MASFDYRLNPFYPIKECSSCGALYTKDYCCSDGSPGDKIICHLDKTLDLSQRPPYNCTNCGNPVDGRYCQGCTLLRKKFKEDLFTYCIENGNLQDSSEPSNDNTNVVNALQEPFVVKQDLKVQEANINIQPFQYSIVPQPPQEEIITSSLSTEEPDNSLSMGDEHLDTVLATESEEFIKSSVESLVSIPSESEGIPDNMCDVPFHDNSPPLDASPPNFEHVSLEVMEIVIPKVRGIDDDILLTIKDDILREKLLNVNLLIAIIKALKDNVTPSFDFMTKYSSTSLNFLLEVTNTFDNSLPESKTFCFDLEEISSGSTTTRSDISFPDYKV
nr:hypothetical protein [Tanacetum cinerariifolium]